MKKRAQITMESLLLYGAAILVVLLAIAALSYFGVLDMGRWLPQKCKLGSGILECDAWVVSASGDSIGLEIKNVDPKTVEILDAEFIPQDANLIDDCSLTSGDGNLLPGKSVALDIDCTTFALEEGQRLVGQIVVEHKYADGQLDMKTTGDLSATVTS